VAHHLGGNRRRPVGVHVGRFGFFTAITTGVVVFVQTLVAPLVAAIVIERLAPRFNSSGSTVDALKLVAYASTPFWVGSVIYLVIYLAPLMLRRDHRRQHLPATPLVGVRSADVRHLSVQSGGVARTTA
jgi:hypothetical protein